MPKLRNTYLHYSSTLQQVPSYSSVSWSCFIFHTFIDRGPYLLIFSPAEFGPENWPPATRITVLYFSCKWETENQHLMNLPQTSVTFASILKYPCILSNITQYLQFQISLLRTHQDAFEEWQCTHLGCQHVSVVAEKIPSKQVPDVWKIRSRTFPLPEK